MLSMHTGYDTAYLTDAVGSGQAGADYYTGAAGEPPAWLPRYDVAVHLDTNQRTGHVTERVTWTNNTHSATDQLVFCFYPHYQVPAGDQAPEG